MRAASSADSKLRVVECVIEPGNAPHPAKWLDLQMLAMTHGGREREEGEWRELLGSTGFRLDRVIRTRSIISLLEATPV